MRSFFSYPKENVDSVSTNDTEFTIMEIAQDMQVSVSYVKKVVQFYEHSNSSLAAPKHTPLRNKFTGDVIEYVE